jgi:hypothetical protein
VSLEVMTRTAHLFPQLRKDSLRPGDWVIIRTMKSEYRLKVLGGALYEARGGWFDKIGNAPMIIGVAGATWGGSAIMPQVLAACGMRMEFNNRLITSPVQSITLLPGTMSN